MKLNFLHILDISFKMALLLTIFLVFIEIIQFISLNDIFFQTWFSLCMLLLRLSMIVLSAYYIFRINNESFRFKFLYSFFSFYIHSSIMVVFFIFLHSYIDTEYKERLSDKQIEIITSKIEKYADNHNFQIENTAQDNQRIKKQALEKYSTLNLLKSTFFTLIPTLIIAFFLSFLIRESKMIEN